MDARRHLRRKDFNDAKILIMKGLLATDAGKLFFFVSYC